MSVRVIRCKKPNDIIVVNGANAQEVAESLTHAATCHSHQIVVGDVYFSRGKRKAVR